MTRDEILKIEIERQLRMGARIDREAARIDSRLADHPPDPVSTGPSLLHQIHQGLAHPGVRSGGRPHGLDGAVSFHFDISHCNRVPAFPLPIGSGGRAGRAAAHQRYVERPGAVEMVESDLRTSDAAAMQEYVERDGALERRPDRIRLCGGTLPQDKAERLDLWRRLEAVEPPPRRFTITAFRDRGDRFWRAVADADEKAPALLRDLATGALSSSNSYVVDAKEAACISAFVIAHADQGPGAGRKPAITIKPGRSGRVQSRLIVELPFGLRSEARLEIVERFCREEFESRHLPYYFALHAPTADNDSRNFHAHILWYERPIERDPELHGAEWDFEIAVVDHDTKNRKTRIKYPFRQPHNRDIAQIGWVKAARIHFAAIVNEVAEREKIATRYDPRTYWSMGIAAAKIQRCKPGAYAMAKRGMPTRAVELASKEQWRREETRLGRLFDVATPDPKIIHRFQAVIAASRTRYAGSAATTWESRLATWRAAFQAKRAAMADKAALDYNFDRIRSRVSPPIDENDAPARTAIAGYLAKLRSELLRPILSAYHSARAVEVRELRR